MNITTNPVQWLYHMILPWCALSAVFVGVYSRVLRSTILDMVNDDFVRTARAKGLTERQVMIRHVLRNSLIPIVSLWGLDFASVIGGGAILTESVFNLQGVGEYAAQSIQLLDVPPVLVITMFGAFFVVLLGAVVDIVYACARSAGFGCRRELDRAAALSGGSPRELPHRGGARARRRRRLFHRRPRRGRGDRRRVGLRQVGHVDDADGADALAERACSRATRTFEGTELIARQQRPAAADPRRARSR